MKSRSWVECWAEHYFKHAKLVTNDNPLALGWCVYIEVYEFD